MSRRLLVKICGLTRPDDALAAARAGADFLGMVFAAGSRRRVEVGVAREIASFVRGRIREANARRAQTPQCGPTDVITCPRLVGVFVDETAGEMNRIADVVGLDMIQLHGDEEPSILESLTRPVIRAIRVASQVPDISPWSAAELVLFDAAAGGSGRMFDWGLLQRVDRPFLLAGGLTPDNVGDAVADTGAAGVDVASGVESSPGVKDHEELRRFVETARAPHPRLLSPRAGRDE